MNVNMDKHVYSCNHDVLDSVMLLKFLMSLPSNKSSYVSPLTLIAYNIFSSFLHFFNQRPSRRGN